MEIILKLYKAQVDYFQKGAESLALLLPDMEELNSSLHVVSEWRFPHFSLLALHVTSCLNPPPPA